MSLLSGQCVATTSGVRRHNPLLPQILGAKLTSLQPRADCVAGWGRKPSFYRAKAFADKHNLPLVSLEDGFLHSLTGNSNYALSVIVDDIGIYFETTHPNRLENLISQHSHDWHDDKQAAANHLIAIICQYELSKYNPINATPCLLGNKNVLIVDQVANDASIAGAGVNTDRAQAQFLAMISHAKKTYPDATIWLKAHPAGKGFFNESLAKEHGVRFLNSKSNPIALLKQACAIYTVSSHMGFEALLLGKRVHCFGVAWYSGFGLTDDSQAPKELYERVIARRTKLLGNHRISVPMLFYAAYLEYSYYGDPASMGIKQGHASLQTALEWLIRNQAHAKRYQGAILSYELSHWKIPFVRQFINTPYNHLTIQPKSLLAKAQAFIGNTPTTPPIDSYKKRHYDFVVAWGTTQAQRIRASDAYRNSTVLCMEDGFIRSQGLGAALLPPLSVVLDSQGIYYNPRLPSDLERLLTSIVLDEAMASEAERLRHAILTQRISKYNVGNAHTLPVPSDRPIHLVVGQVEDDASVRNSLATICTNADLLKKTREQHSSAFIIYKPHPDVEAGLRRGTIDSKTLALADCVAHDIALPDCLNACQYVHTISSLSGFEALLRHKHVTCHGLPFYAGFGLTHDIPNDGRDYQQAIQRRKRETPLSLQALVYATLIAYPLYVLPNGVGLASVWQVIAYLQNIAKQPPQYQNRWQRHLMQLRQRLQPKQK